jgi:hypothetical protein
MKSGRRCVYKRIISSQHCPIPFLITAMGSCHTRVLSIVPEGVHTATFQTEFAKQRGEAVSFENSGAYQRRLPLR